MRGLIETVNQGINVAIAIQASMTSPRNLGRYAVRQLRRLRRCLQDVVSFHYTVDRRTILQSTPETTE